MLISDKQRTLFAIIALIFFLFQIYAEQDVVTENDSKEEVEEENNSIITDPAHYSLEIDFDTLKAKDHEIAKYLGIAKFAQKTLQNEGYAKGIMSDLSFSPNGPKTGTSMGADFQRFLVLSVEEPVFTIQSTWGKKTVQYEVIVHYSKMQYTWPHLALLQAWKLNPEGDRIEKIEVEIPAAPTWWEHTGQKAAMAVCGAIFCSAIVRFIRLGAEKWFLKGKEYSLNDGAEEEKDANKSKKEKKS